MAVKNKSSHQSTSNLLMRKGNLLQQESVHSKTVLASSTSRLRAIGNSKGVILNNQLIEKAGLNADMDVVIRAEEGVITIIQVKEPPVNNDLSTWDKQFKAAIKKGAKPEKDLFGGMTNDFEVNEW